MFMLEVMNEDAQTLLQIWRDSNVDLKNFEVIRQQGYRHIRCISIPFEHDRYTYDAIVEPIQRFIRKSKSPFILSSEDLASCVSAYNQEFTHVFINGHLDSYLDFKWPEQIERYRVALLLKITE